MFNLCKWQNTSIILNVKNKDYMQQTSILENIANYVNEKAYLWKIAILLEVNFLFAFEKRFSGHGAETAFS